jgi:glycosyltransferase involved in cell wall biosynthesis
VTPRAASSWPQVTVVTPSYNQVAFIEETIRSVLLQGYPSLEYIVMDGGSTDGSVEIIRRYEPWLSSWTSAPDDGQTSAINAGWARSTAPLVAWINTDDSYLPGAVATAAAAFASTPSAGLVYGSALVVDGEGRMLRRWDARPFDLRRMLLEGNVVPQPAAFYSRRALDAVGVLDPRWDMIMDFELSLRVGQRFPAIALREPLARFRDHSGSKSRTAFEVTAKELIALISDLPAPDNARGFERVRRTATARVKFELALAYVAQVAPSTRSILGALLDSIRIAPMFALRRPMTTAYILKEAVRLHGPRRVRRAQRGSR